MQVSTLNNILTSGLQSLWLVGLLRGTVTLPSNEAMQRDVSAQKSWRRMVRPHQSNCRQLTPTDTHRHPLIPQRHLSCCPCPLTTHGGSATQHPPN